MHKIVVSFFIYIVFLISVCFCICLNACLYVVIALVCLKEVIDLKQHCSNLKIEFAFCNGGHIYIPFCYYYYYYYNVHKAIPCLHVLV